jgi:quercetin dioxygenase-like cupin family protein
MRRAVLGSIVLVVLALLGGCGSDSKSAAPRPDTATTAPVTTGVSSPTTTVAVQKDVLGTDIDPPGAPGRTLTLIRYTIAPGAQLAPHVHPGVQMASIQSGTLAYTVVSGTATVERAPVGTGPVEAVTGPADTTLGPGDTVVERGDMVHFGANKTAEPVVILATLLTEDGHDLAEPVTTVAPSTTG